MLLLFTTCQNKKNNKLKCIVSKFKIIIGKEYKKALVLDKVLRCHKGWRILIYH